MTTFTTNDGGLLGNTIASYLGRGFELGPKRNAGVTVIDAVIQEFVGQGQCRYGAAPNWQEPGAFRAIVEKSVTSGTAIPILCPWGSIKPTLANIDVADLGALRMLECLNQRVRSHYAPGIAVNLRVEDIGGYYLFADMGEAGREASRHYVAALLMLIKVLGLDCLNPIPESHMMTEESHATLADTVSGFFEAYMTETDKVGLDDYSSLASWKQLAELGWQGQIPFAQREYYKALYRRLYHGITPVESTRKLARYLASSLARNNLKASGADPSWGMDYLRLSFCPPVPALPVSMANRAFYYRTVPESCARTHIPPWRARGFIKLTSGSPCLKIASWSDDLSLQPCVVQIARSGDSVPVNSPFLQV